MIGMCSGGMSSSSLVLGAYLCGCPHAALYHVRHLIFSFTSRFTSVSILIHTVDKVDSFSTEHSKNTIVDTSVKQTRRVCPCLPLLPWLSIRQTLLLDRHFVPVPKLSIKERGGTVGVLVSINIDIMLVEWADLGVWSKETLPHFFVWNFVDRFEQVW